MSNEQVIIGKVTSQPTKQPLVPYVRNKLAELCLEVAERLHKSKCLKCGSEFVYDGKSEAKWGEAKYRRPREYVYCTLAFRCRSCGDVRELDVEWPEDIGVDLLAELADMANGLDGWRR